MGEGDSRAHRRDQEGQGEPLSDFRLEPTSGAFDVDAIAARILRIPCAVRDPNAPSTFLLSWFRDGLRDALVGGGRTDMGLSVFADHIHGWSWSGQDHWLQELIRWLLTRHELRCFDEDYGGTLDIEVLLRQRADEWPLPGTTLADERFALLGPAECVAGTAHRGVFRGIDRATGESVLVTTAPDTVRDAPALPIAGVAELLHVGPLTQPDHGIPLVGMVEREPAGAPSHALASVDDDVGFRWALALARIAQAAHARGEVLGGVRPELVYVTAADEVSRARGELVEHVTIAPRCEPFLMRAGLPYEGAPAAFNHFYQSPERLGEARTYTTPADDVFAIAATLAFWLNNLHPFEGEYAENLSSIVLGRRAGYVIVPDFVEQALAPLPARISLSELIDRLARR